MESELLLVALIFQVLSLSDLDEVYDFAERRLSKSILDENERTFLLWSVKWRREALEHYLKLGWSFIARENGEIAGFFLAQPLLFFRGQVQTLWVEHVESRDTSIAEALVDVAARVAREKHLQRVLFASIDGIESALSKWHPAHLPDEIFEVKTTKG